MNKEEWATRLVKRFREFVRDNDDTYKDKFGRSAKDVAMLNFLIEEISEVQERCDLLERRLAAIEPTDGRSIVYHYSND